MNVVMTGSGRFVEVQGTAEGSPFTRGELDELLALAEHGIAAADRRPAGAVAAPSRPAAVSRDRAELRLVLATANPDKAAEIVAILASRARIELAAPPAEVPEVEETGRPSSTTPD